MPSTQPYVPTKTFGDDPAAVDPIDAAAVDGQLRLIAANLADLIRALGVSIRDDNTLSDSLVRVRNLHPELASYIESAITGTIATQALVFRYPVRVAAPANVSHPAGAQTVDDIPLKSGDFVLLPNQTDPKENGLWEVHEFFDPAPHAAGLWVRRDDLLAGLPSGAGWAVCVSEGTDNGGTAWAVIAGGEESEQPVVGADDLTFFSVFGVYPVPVAKGGTGADNAPAARTNLGVPGIYRTSITGDGSTTVYAFTHNLGSDSCNGWAVNDVTGEVVGVTVVNVGTNTAHIVFSLPPAIGANHRIVIIG